MSESSKRLRKNKDYYLKELEANARRSLEMNKTKKRRNQIKRLRENKKNKVGFYKPKKWTIEEMKFLKENKGKDYSYIALTLKRSLMSVEHKIERMGLQKYNKWK